MITTAFAALLLAAAAPATGAPASYAPASDATPVGQDASIPFADMGTIRNFDPVDRYTIYVQDSHFRWYVAKLMGPCNGLPFANAVSFDVRGTRQLDRFSSVMADGQTCPFESLVTSGPPPGSKDRKPRPKS